MRVFLLVSVALLTSGCWTPGPAQLNPTRYPWAQKPITTYCIVSLEAPGATGITVGGGSAEMACKPPLKPNARP